MEKQYKIFDKFLNLSERCGMHETSKHVNLAHICIEKQWKNSAVEYKTSSV